MTADAIASGLLLDARTLALAATFAIALQAVAMAYVWYVQFRQREVAEFAIGSILIAIGAGLAYARPHLPLLLTQVVSLMAIVAGQVIIFRGIGLFLGRRVPFFVVPAVPAIAGAIVAYFTFVEPSLPARVAVYSVTIAVASGAAAVALFQVPSGPLRVTHWPLAIVLTVQTLLSLGRAGWVLVDVRRNELFESALFQSVWFMQGVVIITLTYVLLVLMITQRPRLELDRQATFDSLTDALNRSAFERLAEIECARSRRHDLPLSLLVLDLDRFKTLNDTHGHVAGDLWLSTFADLCRGLLRREDLLCRYGGEEFVTLLPQTPVEAAVQAAERIRRAVEGMRMTHRGAPIAATVSIGVAARGPETGDLRALIAAGDRAMYRAKAAGRNRVEIA